MKGNFDSIINSEPFVLTDFSAEWCGPCKMQAPILKELAAEMGSRIKIIKVDVDINPEIGARNEVQSIPTLIFFKNGQIAFKHVGVATKEQLRNMILQKI